MAEDQVAAQCSHVFAGDAVFCKYSKPGVNPIDRAIGSDNLVQPALGTKDGLPALIRQFHPLVIPGYLNNILDRKMVSVNSHHALHLFT
jgi:hypothetical protein